MADLWKLTAAQVRAAVLAGDLLLETYVKSLLQRIDARDANVQAWACLDREYALSEARRQDEIPPAQRGPLHGFVIGVKDIMLTKDMPTAYNSPLFASQEPVKMDANPIMTLRSSGALLLGKTETTEFAATTDGPRTRNPHDASRTPGGSSSGSAAAVADFQVPVALGTQTVGSMVRPGSFNGVYAFKPTWGSISREGLAFCSMTCDTFGFFARSVDDLNMLADVFKLEDDVPTPKAPFNLKQTRIGFCKTPVWPHKVSPALEAAWAKAQTILSAQGAVIDEFDLPDGFDKVTEWHSAVLTGEGRTSFLGQYLTDKGQLHPLMVSQVENSTKLSRKAQLEAYDGCARLRPVFDEIASRYDAIIAPSTIDEAPKGYHTGDGAFCLTWSIMHAPVVNIPGFSGSSGLPLGLSLVGARYTDRKMLHTAETIGKLFEAEGGWEHSLF